MFNFILNINLGNKGKWILGFFELNRKWILVYDLVLEKVIIG